MGEIRLVVLAVAPRVLEACGSHFADLSSNHHFPTTHHQARNSSPPRVTLLPQARVVGAQVDHWPVLVCHIALHRKWHPTRSTFRAVFTGHDPVIGADCRFARSVPAGRRRGPWPTIRTPTPWTATRMMVMHLVAGVLALGRCSRWWQRNSGRRRPKSLSLCRCSTRWSSTSCSSWSKTWSSTRSTAPLLSCPSLRTSPKRPPSLLASSPRCGTSPIPRNTVGWTRTFRPHAVV